MFWVRIGIKDIFYFKKMAHFHMIIFVHHLTKPTEGLSPSLNHFLKRNKNHGLVEQYCAWLDFHPYILLIKNCPFLPPEKSKDPSLPTKLSNRILLDRIFWRLFWKLKVEKEYVVKSTILWLLSGRGISIKLI